MWLTCNCGAVLFSSVCIYATKTWSVVLLNKKTHILLYLKCIVYDKLLKPRQSFWITLYIYVYIDQALFLSCLQTSMLRRWWELWVQALRSLYLAKCRSDGLQTPNVWLMLLTSLVRQCASQLLARGFNMTCNVQFIPYVARTGHVCGMQHIQYVCFVAVC